MGAPANLRLVSPARRSCACVRGLLERLRTDLDALIRIPVEIPLQQKNDAATQPGASSKAECPSSFPLGETAEFNIAPGPNQISRENGKRRAVVTADVRGRDLGPFVAEAQERMEAVEIPTGYWVNFGRTVEQLVSAAKRLQIVVPLSLLLSMVRKCEERPARLLRCPARTPGGIGHLAARHPALHLRGRRVHRPPASPY